MMEKPKRPLSSYNLYCRYKHIVLCEVLQSRSDSDVAVDVCALLRCDVGMEGDDGRDRSYFNKVEKDSLRRQKVRSVLQNNLLPNLKRRRHRKSHGLFQYLSFKDVSNILSNSWKTVDPFLVAIFDELADQGRCIYYAKMRRYHQANPDSAPKQPYRPVVRKKKCIEVKAQVHNDNTLVLKNSRAGNGMEEFDPNVVDSIKTALELEEKFEIEDLME